MTWDPHSNIAGLIVGFGMMLISGFFMYIDYLGFKKLNVEKPGKRLVWDMIFEAIFSWGTISKVGFFLLGFLIVVLITLQFFGIVH
jgi:hypothetical protein